MDDSGAPGRPSESGTRRSTVIGARDELEEAVAERGSLGNCDVVWGCDIDSLVPCHSGEQVAAGWFDDAGSGSNSHPLDGGLGRVEVAKCRISQTL